MTEAAEAMAGRHDQWAERLPADVADLWAFVAALDTDNLLDLLTHCTAQTVKAVTRVYCAPASRRLPR